MHEGAAQLLDFCGQFPLRQKVAARKFPTCVVKFNPVMVCMLLLTVQEEALSTLQHGKPPTSPDPLLTDKTYGTLVRYS